MADGRLPSSKRQLEYALAAVNEVLSAFQRLISIRHQQANHLQAKIDRHLRGLDESAWSRLQDPPTQVDRPNELLQSVWNLVSPESAAEIQQHLDRCGEFEYELERLGGSQNRDKPETLQQIVTLCRKSTDELAKAIAPLDQLRQRVLVKLDELDNSDTDGGKIKATADGKPKRLNQMSWRERRK